MPVLLLQPYYDSLLVKITAWDATLPQACRRMDRALREFRIRGVKTNIPFLGNVVNHERFRARAGDHVVPRRLSGAVSLPAPRRPRHQAAVVPGRRHHQWKIRR